MSGRCWSIFPLSEGDSSSGTRNLTGCMFFVGVGVVGKKYGLSTNDWGRLVTTLYERYFDQMPRLFAPVGWRTVSPLSRPCCESVEEKGQKERGKRCEKSR